MNINGKSTRRRKSKKRKLSFGDDCNVYVCVNELDISDLWRLDLIGINYPIEKKFKQEIDLQTKEHFLETVKINCDRQYEVCLPWADDKSPLPDNLHLVQRRMEYTTSKLNNNFSVTTPIRPVFDASARLPNHPSLNQRLECGSNLIELLPDLLLRFREGEFGVIGDIRRAFCQISIREEDRDFLLFLWWENEKQNKLKYFRHTRVVFGVTCSPFLLASVIDYHIRRSEDYDFKFREKLARSFYVDNLVTSVENKELKRFIQESTTLMSRGRFELREWEYSGQCRSKEKVETHVLDLLWNKESDT
ncbi:integrase catalytic domain-containing protein [Trichonephila clavipes]|nr:integrase catalytic domain-containing protein [Trichonephila clavipes]